MDQKIIELKKLIDDAKSIVFFGGAGVSTESGIPDFRSQDGLYKLKSKWDKPYEIMLSHEYFEEETDNFYKFYREFMINKDAKPNYAHIFLANLEKKKDLTIITQNIDGLHQMAGSKNVIELHGSIHRNYCTGCQTLYSLDDILKIDNVPHCPKCGGIIKPDVVLYNEGLDEMTITRALIALQKADLLIVAGTSLKVYPAAGLINYFFGDNIVLINKTNLPLDRKVKLVINDKIGDVFKKVDEIGETKK
jgi:NAD-dependent protein deacetylases, SIR2 family